MLVGVEKFGSLYPFSQPSAKERRIKLPFHPQPSKSMFPIPEDLSIYLGRGTTNSSFPWWHWFAPILLVYLIAPVSTLKSVLIWTISYTIILILVFFTSIGKQKT